MTWFEELTGFPEVSADQVRGDLSISGPHLLSRVNGRSRKMGELETPNLTQLRQRVAATGPGGGATSVRQVVADVRQLHADEGHAGCVFQVAAHLEIAPSGSWGQ